MTDLGFQQGDATWTKLREKSLRDYYFFCSTVLGFANVFPLEDETHALPIAFLARQTGVPDLDAAPMQLVLWPRETGKSTCGTIGYAIWRAVANPDTAVLIANEKHLIAMDFLKAIKFHFEQNSLLRSLFPEVIPPDFNKTEWSATRATLARASGRPEPTFDTIGVGGTVTGKHYDLVIADDLISKEVADSIRTGTRSVLDDVNFWVTTLRPLLSNGAKPFPEIRFIGTRWWAGDTYDFIIKTFGHGEEKRRYLLRRKLRSGRTVSREAYRVGDLAVMLISAIENGQPSFPKIHPQEKLDKMREENPELFAAFMLNDPVAAEVRTFQDSWLRFWRQVDARLLSYRLDDGALRHVMTGDLSKQMVVDPAFTASGKGARAAIVVVGTDRETGKHLVLEALAQRTEPRDLVEDILNLAEKWGVPTVYIESVAQQLGFIQFVQNEASRRSARVVIDTVKPGGRAKDVRIEGLAPYFKSGQLYIHAGQHDLLNEYKDFKPGALYKDLLDALAYAPEHFPRTSPGPANAAQRTRSQLDTYYRLRNLKPTGVV